MKRLKLGFFGLVAAVLLAYSCGKDDVNPIGYVEGLIVDYSTMTGLNDVLVTIFDSNTNTPVKSVRTDVEGNYSVELLPGSYYVRLSKQGYQDLPPRGISPVPFSIVQEMTEVVNYSMLPLTTSGNGWISGTINEGSNPVAGALVVAETAAMGYSAYSDNEGKFYIYNVPAGTYQVKGWIVEYNSDQVSSSVSSGTGTEDVQLTLTSVGAGVFKGQVRNLASENKDVDIALVHTKTRETIPGLITQSVSQSFEISGVPNGTYIARATFANDQRVMDPDRIAKFGEPEVTLNGDTKELTFDITGSVSLKSPSNPADQIIPAEISSTTPTFEWEAYSSSSDYVIEVVDANGNVVWGGFSEAGGLPVKEVTLPSIQLSVVYNFDGSASIAALENGMVYRWRIYASKDDKNSTTGWTLISASEDQLGIFRVVE